MVSAKSLPVRSEDGGKHQKAARLALAADALGIQPHEVSHLSSEKWEQIYRASEVAWCVKRYSRASDEVVEEMTSLMVGADNIRTAMKFLLQGLSA